MDQRDIEVEEDLRLDRQVYGNCFWKVVDGHKVRIHPRNVTVMRDGSLYSIEGGTIHSETYATADSASSAND